MMRGYRSSGRIRYGFMNRSRLSRNRSRRGGQSELRYTDPVDVDANRALSEIPGDADDGLIHRRHAREGGHPVIAEGSDGQSCRPREFAGYWIPRLRACEEIVSISVEL